MYLWGEIIEEPQFSVTLGSYPGGVPVSTPLTHLQFASYIIVYRALNTCCCIYFSFFLPLFLFPTKLGAL